MSNDIKLNEIKAELARLHAAEASVTLDQHFEPKAGELVKIELEEAYWHLPPEDLLVLLKELSDGAGHESVRWQIEQKAVTVWHGPSPKGSRDT